MLNRVRINSSQELLTDRPDLISAVAGGVQDVLVVQEIDEFTVLSTGGLETAQYISRASANHYDQRRPQLYLPGLAQELIDTTDIGSSPTITADFVVSERDLYPDGLNFVFGITWSSIGLSIQSVARILRCTRDQSAQRLHTRHIARHEFAHMRGLNAPSDFDNPDTHGGIYSGHCANVCTMRQSLTVGEALTQAIELQDHELAGFCESCVRKLISTREE